MEICKETPLSRPFTTSKSATRIHVAAQMKSEVAFEVSNTPAFRALETGKTVVITLGVEILHSLWKFTDYENQQNQDNCTFLPQTTACLLKPRRCLDAC